MFILGKYLSVAEFLLLFASLNLSLFLSISRYLSDDEWLKWYKMCPDFMHSICRELIRNRCAERVCVCVCGSARLSNADSNSSTRNAIIKHKNLWFHSKAVHGIWFSFRFGWYLCVALNCINTTAKWDTHTPTETSSVEPAIEFSQTCDT